MNAPARDFQNLIPNARELREKLWEDPHRPRYHLMPPEGFFNDANGTIFWKGRYHIFYLGRMPNPDIQATDENNWLPVWDHSSSRDLVHWIHHPPGVVPAFDGSTPQGIYSGDAIENAPVPTLIYHVPNQGTCLSFSNDDGLIRWTPSPNNPIIPEHDGSEEYVVFDPCGWYEDGTYYALIGNKNNRQGYEGDCTSLFRSNDLIYWEYRGPFYQSNRRWTDEIEDCACPDFFPLGSKHMLLMHGHRPYGQVHYYLGHYENERFYPECHRRMNWPGGQLMAPETLLDDKGRRIFFGWIWEARAWEKYGWASVMSLPRLLSLGHDGALQIEPVPELEVLRCNPRSRKNMSIAQDSEIDLKDISGDCMEIAVEMKPGNARECGIKVRCSPGSEEHTAITYQPEAAILKVELEHSTLDESIKYPRPTGHNRPENITEGDKYTKVQEAPFELRDDEMLKLRIFLDRSVIEVFANRRQCITQRIYPTLSDSIGVRLFARGGSASIRRLDVWDMAPTNPW